MSGGADFVRVSYMLSMWLKANNLPSDGVTVTVDLPDSRTVYRALSAIRREADPASQFTRSADFHGGDGFQIMGINFEFTSGDTP